MSLDELRLRAERRRHQMTWTRITLIYAAAFAFFWYFFC